VAALTKDRNTPNRPGVDRNDPLASGAVIYAGALVVLDASGDAAPATTATGLTARGVAQEAVSQPNGDSAVHSRTGEFRLGNDGSITRADIGNTAYIVDDQTVAQTDGTGTRSAAGIITDVDSVGVWVQID
jgi:hypothetical protein